jgi:hypothetical protein
MRVTRVSARAFGWLRDETLDLSEGLTVVYGPNEAGKSTWHAALVAALSGRWPARAKGEPGIERYRPWSGGAWEVGAEVLLDDGRRVDLRQDLEARHGWATDRGLGRDIAAEITGAKGVPDASRWLGLERGAFVATACVRQAQVAFAAGEAQGIRTYVEGAVAAGTTSVMDGTAAEETAGAALARIDEFRRDQIGSERATTRPLAVAQRRLVDAEQAVSEARSRLAELDRRAAAAAELRGTADAARVRLVGHEASVARAEAARLRRRASEAAALAKPVPDSSDEPAAPEGSPSAVRRAAPRPTPHPTVPAPEPAVDRNRASLQLGLAAALAVAAVAAFVMGSSLVGTLVTIAAVAIGASGFLGWRQSQEPEDRGSEEQAWAAEAEQQAAREDAITRRERLRALLDGGTVADLTESARRAQRRADALSTEAGPDALAATIDDDVDELRRVSQDAAHRAALADKDVAQVEAELERAPVAEAEESLSAARAEVSRLTSLDDVLARTRVYLQRAQEGVHREIAPTLAAAVSRDLATVTGGRYVEAVVDPATLEVLVRGSGTAPLRPVDQVSHGTREQVYLLLRVALAERVVTTGESCPLLLDDVTVHADAGRTERVLDVLLTVARRHQVVLFTQQEQVRDWARALPAPHALRELTALAPV